MKKKTFPVITECVGAIIFALGVIFYFSYAAKITPVGVKLSKELVEKSIYYWNVSAVIMLVAGLFVLLGLLSLMVSVFLEIYENKKEIAVPHYSPVKIIMILVTCFTIPIIFDFLYQPVNENIIVKEFGCGCPKLIDRSISFNANTFSGILWCMVAFVSFLILSKVLIQIKNKQIRYSASLITTSCLFYLVMRFIDWWL